MTLFQSTSSVVYCKKLRIYRAVAKEGYDAKYEITVPNLTLVYVALPFLNHNSLGLAFVRCISIVVLWSAHLPGLNSITACDVLFGLSLTLVRKFLKTVRSWFIVPGQDLLQRVPLEAELHKF